MIAHATRDRQSTGCGPASPDTSATTEERTDSRASRSSRGVRAVAEARTHPVASTPKVLVAPTSRPIDSDMSPHPSTAIYGDKRTTSYKSLDYAHQVRTQALDAGEGER